MVASLLLALVCHSKLSARTPVSGMNVWVQEPAELKSNGYHPFLRFNPSSEYAYGKNMNQTFIFEAQDYICQGHYQVLNGHYSFHPETCFQCGNREIDLLVANLDADSQQRIHAAYARSLSDFEADYSSATGIMALTCPVHGKIVTFQLHSYTEGDDQLPRMLGADDRGVPGLWHAIEPFPDKLDARTRYKIGGLEGLEKFSHEARDSDFAQFELLDLRVNKTYRSYSTLGSWTKEGNNLTLISDAGGPEIHYTISSDGQKLLLAGKPVYERD